MSIALSAADLSPRPGARPATRRGTPHIQLDQFPPASMTDRLAQAILAFPHVREKESQVAEPDVRAFWLPDERAVRSTDAFICDREFCHLHPAPGASLHVVLPDPIADHAIGLGWAERHPLADCGFLPRGLALVYAPRTDEEFDVVVSLVESSCRFATGSL